MTRRWDIPTNHLQTLVQSTQSATNAVLSERRTKVTETPVSIVDHAYESWNGGTATRVGAEMRAGPVSVNPQEYESNLPRKQPFHGQDHEKNEVVMVNNSIMHNPILLATPEPQLISNSNRTESTTTQSVPDQLSNRISCVTAGAETTSPDADYSTTITIRSDYNRLDNLSSHASRRYLNIKNKFNQEEQEIRQLKRSLHYQKNILHRVNQEISQYLSTQSASAAVASISFPSPATKHNGAKAKSDSLALMKNESIRVIAQLDRKLRDLSTTHYNQTKNELQMSQSVSKALWDESLKIKSAYVDTFDCFPHKNDYVVHGSVSVKKRNSMISHVMSSNYGIGSELDGGGCRCGVVRRKVGMRPTHKALCQRYAGLLTKRMSHVVTVNCHLYCPVYCLQFDRTGQYFVPGADDNLVKLFRLGFPHYEGERQEHANKLSEYDKHRGAVLVCTLRGHASAITDIDVSSDNTLLATASDDGDVRVWGMADGCPVAILRGHTGGANMVRVIVLFDCFNVSILISCVFPLTLTTPRCLGRY